MGMVFLRQDYNDALERAELGLYSKKENMDEAKRIYRNHPTESNLKALKHSIYAFQEQREYVNDLIQAKVI